MVSRGTRPEQSYGQETSSLGVPDSPLQCTTSVRAVCLRVKELVLVGGKRGIDQAHAPERVGRGKFGAVENRQSG